MTRSTSLELIWPEYELRRFVLATGREFLHLGHPTQATFAKMGGRGIPAATPADPVMECVGRWWWTLRPDQRQALFLYYCQVQFRAADPEGCQRFGTRTWRSSYRRRALNELRKWLDAEADPDTPAH